MAIVFQDFTASATNDQRLLGFNQIVASGVEQFLVTEDGSNDNFKVIMSGGSTLNLPDFNISTTGGSPQILQLRYDGTNMKIILNGSTTSNLAFTVPVTSSDFFHIGASDENNGTGTVAVKISEIIIWSGALSDSEYNDLATILRVNYDLTAEPAATVLNIGGLTDVSITTPTLNEVIQYNTTDNKWINQALVITNPIEDLTNVTITGIADNDMLVYNSGTTDWENQKICASRRHSWDN